MLGSRIMAHWSGILRTFSTLFDFDFRARLKLCYSCLNISVAKVRIFLHSFLKTRSAFRESKMSEKIEKTKQRASLTFCYCCGILRNMIAKRILIQWSSAPNVGEPWIAIIRALQHGPKCTTRTVHSYDESLERPLQKPVLLDPIMTFWNRLSVDCSSSIVSLLSFVLPEL